MNKYFEQKIPKEIWMPLLFCQGKYHVSSFGRVKSVYTISKKGFIRLTGTILKSAINDKGYEKVKLQWVENNKVFKKTMAVHRLVGMLFHCNPQNKPQINHKDLNKLNNHYLNLEWATPKENTNHAQENGARPSAKPKLPKIKKAKYKEVINTVTNEISNTDDLAIKYGVKRKQIARTLSEECGKNTTPYRYTGNYIWKHINT